MVKAHPNLSKSKREKSEPICMGDYFIKGEFNDRFYIEAKPLGISTGYYFLLIDREGELLDGEDWITFKYEDDADIICDFLNLQEERIRGLSKEI